MSMKSPHHGNSVLPVNMPTMRHGREKRTVKMRIQYQCTTLKVGQRLFLRDEATIVGMPFLHDSQKRARFLKVCCDEQVVVNEAEKGLLMSTFSSTQR